MKVEMLSSGNIESILAEHNINFKKKYSGDKYKVIELEKPDAKKVSVWLMDDAWCHFSNGVGGSPCDIVDVHGSTLIGWSAKKKSYKKLTDYIGDLGAEGDMDVCDYSMALAKANGYSLSKLFEVFEG